MLHKNPNKEIGLVNKEELTVSIKSDDASFYGVRTQISASDRDREIERRIDLIGNELLKASNDGYQFALNFDLQNEKKKLQTFIASELMQENLKFWADSVGVHYIRDNSEELPQNIVCIKINYDQHGLPEYFKVFFKSPYSSSGLTLDLIYIEKECERIKEYKLTYLKNIQEFIKELDSISTQLRSMYNQERSLLISEFNKKWDGQLRMSYVIDMEKHTATCNVQDVTGKVISESSSTRFQMEPDLKTNSESLSGMQIPRIAMSLLSWLKGNSSPNVAPTAEATPNVLSSTLMRK